MKRQSLSEKEIIEKTRETIGYFASRRMDAFTARLDRDFVWIGDYEGLFMKGLDRFLESVREEREHPGVLLIDEEYGVAAHERGLWVTYGRFTALAGEQRARVHFTFVWRQAGDGLRLLHANANHAKSLPETQAKMFEGPAVPREPAGQKLALRDLEGSIHYLSASDVLYIKAEDTVCRLVTTGGVFCCRLPLRALDQPPFLRIHKSYLCNPAYVYSLRRYRIVLQNGAELPVGKERYSDVKLLLRQSV